MLTNCDFKYLCYLQSTKITKIETCILRVFSILYPKNRQGDVVHPMISNKTDLCAQFTPHSHSNEPCDDLSKSALYIHNNIYFSCVCDVSMVGVVNTALVRLTMSYGFF